LTSAWHASLTAGCGAPQDKQRQVEMADRERKTQELLRNRETSELRRQKTVKGQWNMAGRGAVAQNVSMEKVQHYGQAFEKIQQATGAVQAPTSMVHSLHMGDCNLGSMQWRVSNQHERYHLLIGRTWVF
jgi:hypothetical protein